MLFNSSCAFRICSLSSLIIFNYALNSLIVFCNSVGFSFLLSFRLTHNSPSLRFPSSLFPIFLGWDSYSTDISTSFLTSYKNKFILLFLFIRESNHNRIKLVFWFYQFQCWACSCQVL